MSNFKSTPRGEQVGFYFPAGLNSRLKAQAKKNKVSLSALVAEMLAKAVTRLEVKQEISSTER